jgi:hypothetical protein
MNKSLPVVFGIVAGLMFPVPCDAVSPQAQWTIGQTVQTSSGAVRGHAASHASNVSEYLGIPYALPPVGNLRFQPPLRYRGNTTISGETFVGGSFHQGSETIANYDRAPHAFLRI